MSSSLPDPILDEVVRGILSSYEEIGGLNNAEGINLPSKTAVALICENLLEIVFPGFHDDAAVRREELPALTRQRVADVATRFKEEICRSLRTSEPACPETRASAILQTFMRALPGIRELLHTDIEAAYEGDPAALSTHEIILAYPCIEAIAIQRMAHVLYEAKVPLLPRIMTEWAHSRTGIDIHPGATIGTHFFIDHGTGVVIGESCEIGNHVKLYHDVTLGAKSFQRDDEGHILKGGKRHPTVRDRVTIYPGSTILGGETVLGERSTIGGNVFLMQSIPPDSLVYYEEEQLRILNKREKPRSSVAGSSEYQI